LVRVVRMFSPAEYGYNYSLGFLPRPSCPTVAEWRPIGFYNTMTDGDGPVC